MISLITIRNNNLNKIIKKNEKYFITIAVILTN